MPSRPFGPPSSSIRSPQFSTIRGPVLTDRQIDRYIRLGYYGESAKRRLLDREAKPKKREPRTKPTTPKKAKQDAASLALSILSAL